MVLLKTVRNYVKGLFTPEVREERSNYLFALECSCGAFMDLQHLVKLGEYEYGPLYGWRPIEICPHCGKSVRVHAKKVTGYWVIRSTSRMFGDDLKEKIRFKKTGEA